MKTNNRRPDTWTSADAAGDFEVVQLGWNPPPTGLPALASLGASPNPVTGGGASTGTVTLAGGTPATGTVTLTAPAPVGGALVTLKSSYPAAATVSATVLVPAGASSWTFTVTSTVPKKTAQPAISATYAGVTKTAVLTVKRR